jgi:hypothetical protein
MFYDRPKEALSSVRFALEAGAVGSSRVHPHGPAEEPDVLKLALV